MKRPLDLMFLTALLCALAFSGLGTPPLALATDPCASAQNSPPAPGDEPLPTIAGTVTNASTITAITGASM